MTRMDGPTEARRRIPAGRDRSEPTHPRAPSSQFQKPATMESYNVHKSQQLPTVSMDVVVGRNKRGGLYSFGQVLLIGTASACLTAVVMTLLTVQAMSGQSLDVWMPTLGTSRVTMASDARPPARLLPNNATETTNGPSVAWLMSFPNSGTSFTLHMTREATNMTTATNYALEGEIKDQPSVPAIPGRRGMMGPFLELIPNRTTSIPSKYILTKTHCKGFCTGRHCGPEKTIHTPRSFLMGCLTGRRAVSTKEGDLKTLTVTYKPDLVKKAIHIIRHPLDNIVARFHLEYNVQKQRGNADFGQAFPKNKEGFRRWCAADDANQHITRSRFLQHDYALYEKMSKIPCRNEFFRYAQWHNNAFTVSRDLGLPTMVLHYHEYEENFEQTRSKVLDWLEMERTGDGIDFHSGKVYRHYYSSEQKMAIRDFLLEFASVEAWEQLQAYEF